MNWDDNWGNALAGGIKTPPLGSRIGVRPEVESDEDLRVRVMYVAADSQREANRIAMAKGADLDAIAESCGLKRRGS